MNYPPSPRRPEQRTVGGITFDDPFAWLFEESEEALSWQADQDAFTRDFCRGWDGFDALRQRIRDQLTDRLGSLNRPQTAGGRTFTVGRNDLDTAYAVRVADTPGAPSRELVSLAGVDEDGGTPLVVTMMEAAPDGRRLAIATVQQGQHVGSWRVAEAQTGEWLPFRLADQALMNTALPGWVGGSSGFLLHDRDEQGRHRIRHHILDAGAAEIPERVFGPGEVSPAIPGLTIQVSPGGRWAVAVSEPHHRCAVSLCDLASGTWRPFVPDDWDPAAECHGEWLDGETYAAAVSDTDERGRVVCIPAATSQDRSSWREVVAPSASVIRAVTVVQGKIIIGKLDDISLAIDAVGPTSGQIVKLDVPAHSSSMIVVVPRRFPRSEELIVPITSFVEHSTLYHFDLQTGSRTLVGVPGQRWEGVTVEQRFATSDDGVRLPYFVLYRGDLRSQPRPLLMTAYGGFNAAWLPFPLEQNAVFLEEGGIFVHANIRGGGEYGTSWWKGGVLQNIQRSADDLFAVAEDIAESGLSEPDRMAFTGFSHGGFKAGVAVAQRPDLWRFVAPQMPTFDLMEMSPPGDHGAAVKAYLTMNFGDPDIPEQAAYLYEASPYHAIVDGQSYPTVYALHGDNDLGCPPAHGRKFIARLQTANPDGRPHLLRVWKNVAHGTADLDVAAEQYAEWMGLMMRELGMTPAQPNLKLQSEKGSAE